MPDDDYVFNQAGNPEDNNTWYVDTSELFVEGDLDAAIDAKVYSQINEAISNVISEAVLYCVKEGLNEMVYFEPTI
jgi:hypothetical protein